MSNTAFKGFPAAGLAFFRQLERHNDRDWFNAHRAEFDEQVLAPARELVLALGDRLHELAPGINADPRTDKSIFRIHRDTRFSKDKRPYKTHLAIFWWEGTRPKMECPGFYLHLEPRKLMIGGGLYLFQKDQLAEYRRSVDDARLAKQLELAVAGQVKRSCDATHVEPYKKVPRGFPKDHPRAELLKLKGLTLGDEGKVPKSLHSAKFVDYAMRRFEKMAPLHRWLVKLNQRIA